MENVDKISLNQSALEIAKENVYKENPEMPMRLKFEISDKETIDRLL